MKQLFLLLFTVFYLGKKKRKWKLDNIFVIESENRFFFFVVII